MGTNFLRVILTPDFTVSQGPFGMPRNPCESKKIMGTYKLLRFIRIHTRISCELLNLN